MKPSNSDSGDYTGSNFVKYAEELCSASKGITTVNPFDNVKFEITDCSYSKVSSSGVSYYKLTFTGKAKN